MTLDELTEQTGEDDGFVAEAARLGLLSAGCEYTPVDAEKVRLLRLLTRRGVDLATAAKALSAQPYLLERQVQQLYPDGTFPTLTIEEAAEQAGVPVELAVRIREASGVAAPDELGGPADVEALRSLAVALTVGFPEEALIQMVRVYADALGRVAEAEARLFHFYVHERLKAEGVTGDELLAFTDQAIDALRQLTEPAILYFHDKGMMQAIREDIVLHLAEEAGLVPPDDTTGRLLSAIAFVDLARFTALTEAMGDSVASDVLARFSELVRRAVLRCEGRVVKQIGDAFMLVFADPAAALACSLAIRAAAAEEPHFLGTRQGLHWGPVLYREGDYYGASVNLAARIVAEAAADQLLVSEAMRARIGEFESVRFRSLGRRELKHLSEPAELFEVVPVEEDSRRNRVVDPVCGMVIDPDEAAARLAWDGVERFFCSARCLQLFAATPERYA